MFLELSFDSRTGNKGAPQEMSLDELILDFQQSATSRNRSKLNKSGSSSDSSPLRKASPPRHSKMKESDKKSWSFADRARVVRPEPSKKKIVQRTTRNVRDSSSDADGAVTPMPRLEHILRNKPSFALKRRTPATTTTSTRSKQVPVQRRVRSPVLSSPSLTPQSLSPLTSSSVASSPLSLSSPPDEDSIDALIGKDIRDLNKLILTGSRGKKTVITARSPTADEISSVLRQSTRFGKAKDSRLPLRLKVPSRAAKLAILDSPPPPPPPEDEDSDDDEEDSFAEEIRKLRESRRLGTLTNTSIPQQEAVNEETKLESSEICASTALKVRNASNAINELLQAALKPFADRQQEEEKAKALELENEDGGAAIRNAATAELQSATQTIVSQLDLTFAGMRERRKADLKAEEEVAAAAKESQKKEKETTEAKKKADEKEAKERDMKIPHLIPMQGKLLTCSADIENVLEHLESTDAKTQNLQWNSVCMMEAEIEALRSHTQRRIQEIEAQMSAAPPKKGTSDGSEGISWQAVDWVRDNFDTVQSDPPDKGNNQLSVKIESPESEVGTAGEEEGAYQEILQQQVLEKLDLTMLKLKHVLSIDTKEAAEAQEKQQQQKAEQKKKAAQQQLEDERRQRGQEDADTARRRVMGLTSVDEVKDWIEEGRQLQSERGHDRSLNRLIASLDENMNAENGRTHMTYWRAVPPNQEEVLRHFDRLTTTMTAQKSPRLVDNEAIDEHGDYSPDNTREYWQPTRKARQVKKPSYEDLSRSSSGSEHESDNGSSADENMSRRWVTQRRPIQNSTRRTIRNHRSPSPPRQSRRPALNPDNQRRKRVEDQDGKKHDYKHCRSASSSSKSKQKGRRSGVGGLKQDVAHTIHALQAERRQKTWWIHSHRRNP